MIEREDFRLDGKRFVPGGSTYRESRKSKKKIFYFCFFIAMEKSETGSVNHYHFHGNIQNVGNVGGTSNTSEIGNTFLCKKKCSDST